MSFKEEAKMDNDELTEDQPLSPVARLFHQPHLNCYIVAMIGLGKKIDVNVVKEGLEDTLLRHPRFSSIQVLEERKGGKQRWVQTKVVLENHLVVPGLNPEMESANQFVEDYISELSKTTIDISKPLWELHLLNVKTTEAEAIAVFRIHHSLGDGTSLISLLLACTRKSADPAALPTIPENKKAVSNTARGFMPILASLWSFLLLIWNSVVDVLGFMATVVFLKDMETPIKGAAGIEFKAKRIVHRTLSLDDLKLVKNAMNSTVNDVLLGVTSAGLSRYLNRRYGEGKIREVGKNNLPSGIRVRATVMVNIRPAPGIHALGEMMEKEKRDAKWGNCFGYVLLPFSIVMQDDPLDYVRQAKAISDRKKHSYEALFTFSTTALLVRSLGIKTAASATHTILSRTTMSFSNVVGPMEEISFYGHPIVYLAPTVYGPPQALIIHFQSYMNKVKMVLAVDEDVIPDPHQLCADLAESLDLIKDAVVSSR